jgi:V/A-type H+-transporting ATPase subunit I
MFKPLAMQRISLKIIAEDAPAAALALAGHGWFGPETANLPDKVLPGRPSAAYHKIFRAARARLDKLAQRADYPRPDNAETRVISLVELEKINARLGELWNLCSRIEEQQLRLKYLNVLSVKPASNWEACSYVK